MRHTTHKHLDLVLATHSTRMDNRTKKIPKAVPVMEAGIKMFCQRMSSRSLNKTAYTYEIIILLKLYLSYSSLWGPLGRWFRRPGLIRTLRGSRNAVSGNYSATRRNHFRPAFLGTNSGDETILSSHWQVISTNESPRVERTAQISAETVHGVSCSRRPFIDVGRCFSGSWPTRQREKTQIHWVHTVATRLTLRPNPWQVTAAFSWILKSAADCTLTKLTTKSLWNYI